MGRNFYISGLSSRSALTNNNMPTGLFGANHATRSSNILHFPPAQVRSAPGPTGEPSGSSFYSTLKQWAIDILAITAWTVLTVATASGLVASFFLLFFCRL